MSAFPHTLDPLSGFPTLDAAAVHYCGLAKQYREKAALFRAGRVCAEPYATTYALQCDVKVAEFEAIAREAVLRMARAA